MFHWICPECGQEIAPGVKECPVCEPQTAAPALPKVAVEEPAPAVVAVPSSAPEPTAPALAADAVVLHPEVVLRPEVVMPPKPLNGVKPPVVLDALPAEARPVVMPDVPPGAFPADLPKPAVDTPTEPETFADRLDELAERLHAERIPYSAPGPPIEKPASAKATVVLDVPFQAVTSTEGTATQALLAAPPRVLLLAEPQPPSLAKDMPIQAFDPRPCGPAVPRQEVTGVEAAPPAPVQLPDPPSRKAAPGLASMQSYRDSADRLMRPAEFATSSPPAAVAIPKVTLPGPALPRELMSLQAAGLVPIRRARRKGEAAPSGSNWVMRSVVLGILLTAGVATYNMMPGTVASAPPRPSPEPSPEPPVSARSTRPVNSNSLARFVEVTGIRFMDVNKKPQIHYLVVNHSSAPMSSVTVYVTLRSATAKPGQAPIARLNFRSPPLAAYEAKEMFSSIERASSPLDLPDWQDLHADVEVQ